MDHIWMVRKSMEARGTPVTEAQADEMLEEYARERKIGKSLVTADKGFYAYADSISRFLKGDRS